MNGHVFDVPSVASWCIHTQKWKMHITQVHCYPFFIEKKRNGYYSDVRVKCSQYMNSICSHWHRPKVWGFYNLSFIYSVFVHKHKIPSLAHWWQAHTFIFFTIENILMDKSSWLQLKLLKLLHCDADLQGRSEILLSRTHWYGNGNYKNWGDFVYFQAQTVHGSSGSLLL